MKSRFVKISTRIKVLSAVAGIVLAGAGAYAATNWVVGVSAGSSGQSQSATISNLSITAVSSPSPTNLLYPGGTGDVVVTISNPNPYPVTITAVQLPTNTTYATGYTTSALTTTQTGCLAATPSAGRVELRHRHERELAHAHHTTHRGSERSGQQPARRDLDERCEHGVDVAVGLREHLLLIASADGGDSNRWSRNVHDDSCDRRLDELIDRISP